MGTASGGGGLSDLPLDPGTLVQINCASTVSAFLQLGNVYDLLNSVLDCFDLCRRKCSGLLYQTSGMFVSQIYNNGLNNISLSFSLTSLVSLVVSYQLVVLSER